MPEEPENTPETPDPANAPAPTPEASVTMTQAQLDAQAAAIRKTAEREAKKAAERQLSEALGVSLEDAKKIIADQKAAAEAAKDETQKAIDAAAARETAAQAREAAALAKERAADVKLALMEAGVNPARLARATTLLVADVTEDADAEAISAAAVALKTEMPELFGAASGGAPSGDPAGGPPGKSNGGPVGIDAGRARAQTEIKKRQESYVSPFAGLPMIGGNNS